ncbi:MAG TPA: TrkA family potassium uptake protein [Thermomicrobiales bacterium]|jgi:trk system potassium uptake protein|nr:TrkA family potassium uptake protein [Thermomicrobiales bacterium]
MYIIVVGGGKVGYYLTKTLVHEGYEVLLIEKNPAKCAIYTERFGAVVMNGDGAEASTLAAAGAGRADVVISVTGHDEDNLVICQLARHRFKVKRTIARVNNPKNEELFRRLGVDVTVNPTSVILSLIEQQIPDRHFVHLLALRHAKLAVVEASVAPESSICGRSVSDIRLPPETSLIAILRASDVIIPTGQTQIMAGDEIIAITRRESEEQLRDLLVTN